MRVSTHVCEKSKEEGKGQESIQSNTQGSQRLEKYLNLEGFLEKSLKIKSPLKSTGKSLKALKSP